MADTYRSRRDWDAYGYARQSRRIEVKPLDTRDIRILHSMAVSEIGPEIASLETMIRVLSKNPGCTWTLHKRDENGRCSGKPNGFFSFLELNALGYAAVLRDRFAGRNPDLAMLCTPEEYPSALYSWATVANGLSAYALPTIARNLQAPAFCDLDIFTRPGTEQGARILRNLGYRPVLPGACGAVGDLLVYERQTKRIAA